jgi:HEAT repeat protein
MFSLRLVAIGLVSVCLLPAIALAQEPPAAAPAAEQLARLIADLGSEEFTVRESASESLTRIGLPAFAALEAAATHPDREVRYRSQRILGLIREHDLKRRLEAFLAGKEQEGDYPLPGWTRFKKTYGDESQTRSLFVEIQRADAEMMRSLEDNPRAAADAVSQRVSQLQDALRVGIQQQLTLGQVAACLFVAAEEDVALPASSVTLLLSQCYQQSFRDAITGNRGELPKKMLATIIRRAEDTAAYQAMNVAYQYNMPEGIVPALKILNKKAVVPSPYYSQYALRTVARTGDPAHLPLVESLLTDKSPVTRMQQNQETFEIQLRDGALATAILLTKQDLKDYFDIPANQQVSDPQQIFSNPRLIGFKTEADRQAVFKKWEAYKAKQGPAVSGQPAEPEKPASPAP